MTQHSISEFIDGLPNICGRDEQVVEVTAHRSPDYLSETKLRLERFQAVFAVARHMQQPLIPSRREIRTAVMIGNRNAMLRNPGVGDHPNAPILAERCARPGNLIPELAPEGRNPREIHLPKHPDDYEYVRFLKECGYRWLHLPEEHLPHRPPARKSAGEEFSIVTVVETQGSDAKLRARRQPYDQARGLQRQEIGGVWVPRIVTRIGDGENGGMMTNEFPDGSRQAVRQFGVGGVVHVIEYLEMLDEAGVAESMLPTCRPLNQGAAYAALAILKKEKPQLQFEGGSRFPPHSPDSWLRERPDADEPAERPVSRGDRHSSRRPRQPYASQRPVPSLDRRNELFPLPGTGHLDRLRLRDLPARFRNSHPRLSITPVWGLGPVRSTR
jgi:hypothetical protein